MKKIYTILLGISVVIMSISCSNKDFADKYTDPSKTSTATCDKLMTGAFTIASCQYQNYTSNTYWRMYTWDHYFAQWAQIIGYNNNSGSIYGVGDSYAANRWDNFYKVLTQFRVMQNIYENEAEEEKEQDIIFLDITEVFVIDNLSQLVDIFGPVPYSKAGYLGITGDLATSYPSYDSDEELYSNMLNRLDVLYSDITALKSSLTQGTISKLVAQDFINQGNLDKWLTYANALRLRLAIHVAAKGNLTSAAKTALSSAAGRQLPTNLEESILLQAGVGDGNTFNYWEHIRDAFCQNNYTASQKMIDAMQVTGNNDPRLKILYTPNAAGEFFGKSVNETVEEQNARDLMETEGGYEKRYYAHLDSITFISCSNMRFPIVTAAETYFTLAEAYQQGYLNGNAKSAFVNGVKQSIIQYFTQNMKSSPVNITPHGYKADEAPTDAEMEAYANAVWDKYTNKMEAIMTQKWIHFGIMQATQAWTDIRRTGYPALTYPKDEKSASYPNIIQRVRYPNAEFTNNTDNYKAAAATVGDDSAQFTLFWAQTLK